MVSAVSELALNLERDAIYIKIYIKLYVKCIIKLVYNILWDGEMSASQWTLIGTDGMVGEEGIICFIFNFLSD